MHDYIADPAAGQRRVYRMDRAEMERHGRGQSLLRTAAVVVALFALQYPMRQVALGEWEAAGGIARATSARLSLLVDLVMIGAYLTLAWRALELMWAWRRQSKTRHVAYGAAGAVVIGALLDLAENVVLWRETGDGTWQGDLTVAWSLPMVCLVAVGLLVLLGIVSFAWWRWSVRPPDPDTAPEVVEQPGRVICCSGGGVRSASFCLGGLQELTAAGLYAETDRVIGVSGGGYIAAAYHTVRWHSGSTDEDDDVKWKKLDPPAFAPSSPELQRLRRNSRYLLDSGNSVLQGLLSLLFGIAVNLVLLTAAIGATAWLLGWYLVASGALTDWGEVSAAALDFGPGPWGGVLWVWLLPVAGMLLFVVEKAVDKYRTAPFDARIWLRGRSRELLTWGALLTALLLGVPVLLAWMHDLAAGSGSAMANLLHTLGFVPSEVCLEQLTAGRAACGVTPPDPLTEGQAIAAAGTSATVTGVSAGGAAAVVAAVLAVVRSARSALGDETTPQKGGTRLGGLVTSVWPKVKGVVLPWAAAVLVVLVLLVLLLRWTAGLVAAPERLAAWDLALGFLVVVLGVRLLTDANRTSLHHFYREQLSFAFVVRRSPKGAGPLPYRKALRFSESQPSEKSGPRLVACAVANITDPGLVPVGRGCAPFVFDDTEIGLTDQQLPSGAARTRSQLFEYAADRRFRDATIPAAMAMSGAAFSPLVGRENARVNPYRLVLALANARLGVWLPNPLWIDDLATVRRLVRSRDAREARLAWTRLTVDERNRLVTTYLNTPDQAWLWDLLPDPTSERGKDPGYARPPGWKRPDGGGAGLRVGSYRLANAVVNALSKPGPGRLLKEAVGRTSVYDRQLYITDGGHYDNLGLVEALRRRPKEIIVLDASSDPEDTFRALGQAIATARMDLDCEVIFDPRSMRRLTEERSTAAWGNGRYRFGDGTTGVIRMVKVIMVQGLPWDVEAYSGSHPTFPRTGTADQLYDEFDLEAYRVLGREVMRKLIAHPPPPPPARRAPQQPPSQQRKGRRHALRRVGT